MEKNFKMVGDKLHVTFETGDKVFIPVGEEQKEVGEYKQVNVQIIDKDKIQTLIDFTSKEIEVSENNLKKLIQKLEPIKGLQEIDDELLKAMKESLKKGSKTFRDKMAKLNQRINDLDLKKGLNANIKYYNDRLADMKLDLKQLNAAIKK